MGEIDSLMTKQLRLGFFPPFISAAVREMATATYFGKTDTPQLFLFSREDFVEAKILYTSQESGHCLMVVVTLHTIVRQGVNEPSAQVNHEDGRKLELREKIRKFRKVI